MGPGFVASLGETCRMEWGSGLAWRLLSHPGSSPTRGQRHGGPFHIPEGLLWGGRCQPLTQVSTDMCTTWGT